MGAVVKRLRGQQAFARKGDRGDQIVLWPKHIQEKDINDMVLSGQNVQKMVESNIYQGLEAKLKLQDWKRV